MQARTCPALATTRLFGQVDETGAHYNTGSAKICRFRVGTTVASSRNSADRRRENKMPKWERQKTAQRPGPESQTQPAISTRHAPRVPSFSACFNDEHDFFCLSPGGRTGTRK
jgi:hypothetical protein